MENLKLKTAKSKFNAFIGGIKENVTEGARVLSEFSAELLDEAKEKAEELYEAGHDKFEQASGVIHDYTERYKGHREIKKLCEVKEELSFTLGDAVFHEFKKTGAVSKRFLTTKKISSVIKQIEELDKEVLKIGKELDSKNQIKS